MGMLRDCKVTYYVTMHAFCRMHGMAWALLLAAFTCGRLWLKPAGGPADGRLVGGLGPDGLLSFLLLGGGRLRWACWAC